MHVYIMPQNLLRILGVDNVTCLVFFYSTLLLYTFYSTCKHHNVSGGVWAGTLRLCFGACCIYLLSLLLMLKMLSLTQSVDESEDNVLS